MKKILLLFLAVWVSHLMIFAQTVKNVNPSLFLSDGSNVTITTILCTLSDGTSTTCYQIETTGMPTDHNMGPWCPDNISDGAEAGGIWLENGEVHDVDGAFIQNMATFYNDSKWLMYDANGDIYTTETQEDCANAANPAVGAEYENFCVECLPAYITDITQTYLIPTTPVGVSTSIQFGGMGPTRPGQTSGPSVRGLAFNGVRFDAAAPTDAILGAYTLAPFDDAGGHINLNAGYHYHAATGVSTEIAQNDGHAPMIGYALDGHSMYARTDENGNEPSDLDACRGHYDDTRGYHYHVDAAGSNNFINCLNGAYVTASGATVSIDNDEDGYNLEQDCDDNNAAIHPGATEIANNDIDENCDGIVYVSNCETGLIIVGEIATNTFQVSGTITSTGAISSGETVTFQGNEIILSAGFQVAAGATFLAEIAPCTATNVTNETTDKATTLTFKEPTNKVAPQHTLLHSNNRDKANKRQLTLFPNPAGDVVIIQFSDFIQEDLQVYLFDIHGKLWRQESVNQGNTTHQLDLRTLHNGIYFVKIFDGVKTVTERVIIQK